MTCVPARKASRPLRPTGKTVCPPTTSRSGAAPSGWPSHEAPVRRSRQASQDPVARLNASSTRSFWSRRLLPAPVLQRTFIF